MNKADRSVKANNGALDDIHCTLKNIEELLGSITEHGDASSCEGECGPGATPGGTAISDREIQVMTAIVNAMEKRDLNIDEVRRITIWFTDRYMVEDPTSAEIFDAPNTF